MQLPCVIPINDNTIVTEKRQRFGTYMQDTSTVIFLVIEGVVIVGLIVWIIVLLRENWNDRNK